MKMTDGEMQYGREISLLTDQGERIKRKVRYSAKYGLHVIVKDKVYTCEDLTGVSNDISVVDLAKKFCKSGVTCAELRAAVESYLFSKNPILDSNGFYRCENCNALLNSSAFQNFCSECGQRIDWSKDGKK